MSDPFYSFVLGAMQVEEPSHDLLREMKSISDSLIAAAAAAGPGRGNGVALPTASRATEQASPVTLAPPGQQLADRLFLQTAKLKLLIACLEALQESAIEAGKDKETATPRSIAFAPEGMYLTVAVPNEGRTHTLALPKFFFVRYWCPAGFRVMVDLSEFIFLLNQIYSTHQGRCLEIMDQPDNTLLVHALLDGNKFFDAPLKTHVVSNAAAAAPPILDAAYARYPFMLQVSTDWLHGIFKRLQQRPGSEVIVEFNGETRMLEFLITMGGSPRCEGMQIPETHVLPNPFLAPAANQPDTHVVYTDTKIVTEAPQPTVPAALNVALAPTGSLSSFRYRAQFLPRAIWTAVKRNKVGSFVHLFLAPDRPLVIQYELQRSPNDFKQAAVYTTWIRALAASPHVKMPAGGAQAVAKKMLEIQPNLGTQEQTWQAAATAVQAVALAVPTSPATAPVLGAAAAVTTAPVILRRKPVKKEPPASSASVKADGLAAPVKKKRGRPPKPRSSTK